MGGRSSSGRGRGGVRGKPQSRPRIDVDPGAIVTFNARMPAGLRDKLRDDAAAHGMSAAAYLEQLLRQVDPAQLDLPTPLPLAESA